MQRLDKDQMLKLGKGTEGGKDSPSNYIIIIIIIIFTAIGLSPGGSGYFTCIQNMKLVTTEFKSGGLHEKHVGCISSAKLWKNVTCGVNMFQNQQEGLRKEALDCNGTLVS